MMKEKLLMLVLAGCLLVSACGSGAAGSRTARQPVQLK